MSGIQKAAAVSEGNVEQVVFLALREVIRKLDRGVCCRAAENDDVVIPKLPSGAGGLDDRPASTAKRCARFRESDLRDRTRKLVANPPVPRCRLLFDIDVYDRARSRRATAEEEDDTGDEGSIHFLL